MFLEEKIKIIAQEMTDACDNIEDWKKFYYQEQVKFLWSLDRKDLDEVFQDYEYLFK